MKKILKYILNIVTTGSIIIGTVTIFQYGFYAMMPMSFWVEYHSVKPLKNQFVGGEDLIFRSIATIKRTSDVEFVDTLKCNIDEGFGNFSQYTSRNEEIDKTETDSKWTYQAPKPQPPRTCFLRTVIVLKLPFGITKDQVLIGENFDIK